MRILVAIDGSPLSDAALDEIAARPWPAGSELRVVTVTNRYMAIGSESWALPPAYYDELAKAVLEAGEKALASALERIAVCEGTLAVTGEVLFGASAAHSILEEAERWGADLIVVGSHGYGAVKRFFLGSVSHAVAMHARCSVEIVRVRE